MHKHPRITRTRVRRTVERWVVPAVYGARAPVDLHAFHVAGEPVDVGEALRATYEPFSVGDVWGPAWGTTWFRLRAQIPQTWDGRRVALLFRNATSDGRGLGGEVLAYRDGQIVGGMSRERPDLLITPAAAGGEMVELYLEAASNPRTPPSTAPPLLMADPSGPPLLRVITCELAVVQREIYDLLVDFRVLLELCEQLPETDPRSGEILYALNDACNALDPGDIASTARAARDVLRGVLSAPAPASAHRLSAVGHAHLDTAWLWPLREAVRKAARTFSTAVALMDEYPEYRFVCSQAQHYAWMQDRYPELYDRIREKVKAGQFEPVGSLWVETDCNVPSGESLVRQILHGKLFFAEELGYETEDLWLPDVFGYSAALPQIMAQAGIRYFLTQKISWSQFNTFPHHTFWWEGIDGTRIFTHFPPADTYNGDFSMASLHRNVSSFREHGRASRSLYVYGYGDGGGGPTRDMIETALRLPDLESAPRVTLEPAIQFFRKASEDARDLAVWVGELYLEFHRGTYTTQARTKRNNRLSELLLREAELWSSARSEAWDHYPSEQLDAAWKTVLLNQFHDILPGSSIHWVYEDTERDYAQVRAAGEQVVQEALAGVAASVDTSGAARPVVVFNPAPHDHAGVVALGVSSEGTSGQPLDGNGTAVWAQIPACGYAVVDLQAPSPGGSARVNGRSLENEYLVVEWDDDGLLTSVYDKQAGREALAAGSRGNILQLHPDYPNDWDAWDVDLFYREQVHDITDLDAIEVVERGPLRAAVRMVRKFGRSEVVQTMRLSAGSRLIEFDTEIDWNEDHRFLKVAFPVDVRSARATYEIQFGAIERPTHYNTSWDLARFEVCAQRWADLSEPGYGVALINDCKYGYDIHGNVMRLSLLRAPTWPDPQADRGRHRFRYGLLPHVGGLQEGGVVEQAYAFNTPVRSVPAEPGPGPRPSSASFVRTDRPNVVVDTVKRAEREDALVVRLYEAWGARGSVRVTVGLPAGEAVRCDLLERDTEPVHIDAGGVVELDFRPFEIITLKLRA